MRSFLNYSILLLAFAGAHLRAADRPNIVWIVSEDNSACYLRLYDPQGAPTPRIEALAHDGIVFEHAFSNAPVCSVARSTLISGSYAPRLGVQYHRRAALVPMPAEQRMFPAYLRDAGYYTSNNSKEDYNAIKPADVWDDSSGRATYRNRKPGQPFFHVQNFGSTHEGKLFFTAAEMAAERTMSDPAKVRVPAYLPDTPTFRYSIARYLDLQMKMDTEIGDFIDRLAKDGVLDDTIIFYYGDNGGILPRSKGYAYESGLQIPLVVHVPPRWQHLVNLPAGSREPGFVNFYDFGPTVLALAGAPVPARMDGQPFLGPNVNAAQVSSRNETFGYADRFDEKYDFVRTVRRGRFKYMRSYQPFNVDALFNQYRYHQLAYREWARLYREGQLPPVQRQFFEPRAAEALYDLNVDPDETHNLANDPEHAAITAELRARLTSWVKDMPDLGFYPESYFAREAAQDPTGFSATHREEIARLVDVANLSLQPFAEASPRLTAALASPNPWERYWALIACSSFGGTAAPFVATAKHLALRDPEPLVRVRAAEFLGLLRAGDPVPVLENALANSTNAVESLLILNTITLLKDYHGYKFSLTDKNLGNAFSDLTNRLDYLKQ
ncbi:MAG: sulfatase-like hydrolase/transferase [Lacunisphaera sp.]|nr:sulfatase-like hydrolase/transferase [Lacunisphaera sp.]